jgi:hypothetical protein
VGTASPKSPKDKSQSINVWRIGSGDFGGSDEGAFAARPAFLALAMLVVAIAPSAVVDSTAALVRVGIAPFAHAMMTAATAHPAPKNASNNP